MPKINYLIINLDERGNLITQKRKCLKFMKKGEYYEIPLNKGEYNRKKINQKLIRDGRRLKDEETEK